MGDKSREHGTGTTGWNTKVCIEKENIHRHIRQKNLVIWDSNGGKILMEINQIPSYCLKGKRGTLQNKTCMVLLA